MCKYVCVCVHVSVYISADAPGGQQRALDSLGLALQLCVTQ